MTPGLNARGPVREDVDAVKNATRLEIPVTGGGLPRLVGYVNTLSRELGQGLINILGCKATVLTLADAGVAGLLAMSRRFSRGDIV